MDSYTLYLLLADDDEDDQMLFHEALKELPVESRLVTVKDGVQLMAMLLEPDMAWPDIIFLDLNMPKKTGMECLAEIKQDERLRQLPVVIYSTSFIPDLINELYDTGAHYYIRKPGEFAKLKRSIHNAISRTQEDKAARPAREHFVIQP